jgi:hypothetical protein
MLPLSYQVVQFISIVFLILLFLTPQHVFQQQILWISSPKYKSNLPILLHLIAILLV